MPSLQLGRVQLEFRLDVGVGNFEACLVASAHQAGPGDLSSQLQLQGGLAGAAACQYLSELLGIHSHMASHAGIGSVHVVIGRHDVVALGLAQFEDLIDEAVDRFLAGRWLVGAQFHEF
jgi:hypothetical protein